MKGIWNSLRTIDDSLKSKVERGEISIRSAAISLYNAGKFTFVPNDREVIKYLHIII